MEEIPYRWPVSVIDVKVGFVTCLESNKIIAQDVSTLLRNIKSKIGRVVEWNTKVPPNVYQGGDIAKHPKELCSVHQRGSGRLGTKFAE
jgi:hypothetical protein